MSFQPKDAVEFLRHVGDVDSENRNEGLEDLRFSAGNQWPQEVQTSRALEQRPCLTINKIDAHIRQITNAQRQQRPQIKAHPMDGAATPKVAEVLTGLTRHIELNSDADQAYDNAFNYACRVGWGYWRVVTDYTREDSFDQDIYVRQIENPFSVYFDPDSTLPDGSDAEKCLITDLIGRDAFKRMYPGADLTGFQGETIGDTLVDWIDKDSIRIAEYFTLDRVKDKLVMLSDGSTRFASELPDDGYLQSRGLWVTGDRDSYRRKVMWRKVSAYETLEERTLMGRWIPVIPTYGDQLVIDGKRKKFGMVRYARDPQVMFNFWRTAMTESVAMAPKAKWLMAEGQDEGFANEWARANISPYPVLHFKQTDSEGSPAPRPERLQPEPPPSGAMEAAMAISADLQAVLGMYDPSMGRPSGGDKSGAAIRAEQGQGELSNSHYFDNLTRSIKHTGRIILDLIPKVYDTHRVARIIGVDGRPDLVHLNQPMADPTQEAVSTILNDVTVGEYDVVMDVGPSMNSKRQEAVEAMSMMLQTSPEVFQIAGDLLFRNMDFPGADQIADRLAASNPMAQIDKNSDVPPQAQMMIKQLQTKLQQTEQQLQEAAAVIKSRSDIEAMKQEAETRRELMRVTGKAHDTERWVEEERDQFQSTNHTRQLDTHVKAMTAMNVAEINQHGALLAKHMDGQPEADDKSFERWKVEREIESREKIEQMKLEAAALLKEKAEEKKAEEKSEKVEPDVMGAINKLAESLAVVHQHITAPRTIVRGPDGKATGIDIGGVVKQIQRGPDGRALGVQ